LASLSFLALIPPEPYPERDANNRILNVSAEDKTTGQKKITITNDRAG
jgi:hypothetical protein